MTKEAWTPALGEVDPVFTALPDGEKVDPWRRAPRWPKLRDAIMGGIADASKYGLLFSYGGGARRDRQGATADPDLLAVPYLNLARQMLLGDQCQNPIGIQALDGIEEFAGNVDLYTRFKVDGARGVVPSVASRVIHVLKDASIRYRVQNSPNHAQILVDDWRQVFPLWRGWVRINGQRPVVATYEPDSVVADCEIDIRYAVPEANPGHKLVVTQAKLVDEHGNPVAHGPAIFANYFPQSEAEAVADHRFLVDGPYGNAVVYMGPHRVIGPGGADHIAIPEIPPDANLAYTLFFRRLADIMLQAQRNGGGRERLNELLERYGNPLKSYLDIIISGDPIRHEKKVEGLMQIIRLTTLSPHAFAYLAQQLGLGKIFSRAVPLIDTLSSAYASGEAALPLDDTGYTDEVNIPSIAVRDGQYELQSSVAIIDEVDVARGLSANPDNQSQSPIDAFSALWHPKPAT